MTKNLTIPLTEETETRLRNIMEIQALDSLEAAVSYALIESERRARIKRLIANASPDEAWANAFDPASAAESLRGMENPLPPHDDVAD